MYTPEALLDIHLRAHTSLAGLLDHCRAFTAAELDLAHEGFGVASVRLQLHHIVAAERYWTGVLRGLMLVDEDAADFPDVAALAALCQEVAAATAAVLRGATGEYLSAPRPLVTWGGRERAMVPAHVVLRVVTHIHHHLGQVAAMCRRLGRPVEGLDFPLA